jgi:alginate O-acetyltransferase complex protein AlgI
LLFNSFHYFVFLAIVLLFVDSVRRRNFQSAFLLAASYYFYWVFSARYVLVVIGVTLFTFYCAKAIDRAQDVRHRRILLVISLVGQLGVLGYFKYTNFAMDGLKLLGSRWQSLAHLHHLEIVLPIGISFYTFMSISYTVDVYYKRLQPVDSLRTFALFITFFPHLVAGPILRATEFLPQLRRRLVLSNENFRAGFSLILLGLIKKLVIADNLSGFVKETFSGQITNDSLTVIVGAVAFAIQIFCDFSGYSDIAIGSARVLGLNFPANFHYPYFAKNISEFWRRWHISLSTWLRDYLYFPLGGNRINSKPRQYLSLVFTMILAGLWHGAAWNFLLWGLYYGILLCAHRYLLASRKVVISHFWDPLKMVFTFWLVCIGWVIFIVNDWHRLGFYLGKMLFLDPRFSNPLSFVNGHQLIVLMMLAFAAGHIVSYRIDGFAPFLSRLSAPRWAMCMILGVCILYLFAAGQMSFIYFRF